MEHERVTWKVGALPVERFWALVGPETTTGCRLWRGARLRNGYGRIMIRRRMYLAHRLAVEIRDGRPPTGLVLHSCDTPLCVAFAHLQEGTQSENTLQAVARGRYHPNRGGAKLTAAQVEEIRRRHAAGEQIGQLAADFNVWRGTVSNIVHRRTWKG